MKKYTIISILVFCLILSGCGTKLPEKAADGTPWSSEWTSLGAAVGVEPMEGWTVQRNEDALAAEGLYYASWVSGDRFSYTGSEGNEITAYDGQIHLVIQQCKDSEGAQQCASQWEAMAQERYPEAKQSFTQYSGQGYSVSRYTVSHEANLEGVSATAHRGNLAIQVDVVALAAFSDTPEGVLAAFLEHCHFAR